MTYEELQQKIADVESMIDVRFAGAMEAYHTYYMDGKTAGFLEDDNG
jgi:hypothetical protein